MLRVLSGIPAAAALLALFHAGPVEAIALVLLAVAIAGTLEFHRLARGKPGCFVPIVPLLGGVILIMAGPWFHALPGLSGGLFLAIALWCLVSLLGAPDPGEGRIMPSLAMGVFGLAWIAWPLGHALLIALLPNGRDLLLYLVLTLVLNDSIAYFAGTFLGRHLMAPAISPKKTWEGSLGGMAGGALGGVVGVLLMTGGSWHPEGLWYVLLGVPLALLGQAGDLLESLFKRYCGVKDSGFFLPGHGGFLDRLDVFLLAVPFLYYLSPFLGNLPG